MTIIYYNTLPIPVMIKLSGLRQEKERQSFPGLPKAASSFSQDCLMIEFTTHQPLFVLETANLFTLSHLQVSHRFHVCPHPTR